MAGFKTAEEGDKQKVSLSELVEIAKKSIDLIYFIWDTNTSFKTAAKNTKMFNMIFLLFISQLF